MAWIRVQLRLPDGKRRPARVPDDKAMRRVVPALVTRIGLPENDEGGNRIVYRLQIASSGKNLGDDDTLASRGISEGSELDLRKVLQPAAARAVADSKDRMPVLVQRRKQLLPVLIQIDDCRQMREYQQMSSRWETAAWTFGGAAAGVISNWFTEPQISIPLFSFVLLAAFAGGGLICFFWAKLYQQKDEGYLERVRGSLEEREIILGDL